MVLSTEYFRETVLPHYFKQAFSVRLTSHLYNGLLMGASCTFRCGIWCSSSHRVRQSLVSCPAHGRLPHPHARSSVSFQASVTFSQDPWSFKISVSLVRATCGMFYVDHSSSLICFHLTCFLDWDCDLRWSFGMEDDFHSCPVGTEANYEINEGPCTLVQIGLGCLGEWMGR